MKKELGPMAGGDLMRAWRRAGMTDAQRKAEDRKQKIERLKKLAEDFDNLKRNLMRQKAHKKEPTSAATLTALASTRPRDANQLGGIE